ncbi:MAG TPA: hypothetical protein VMZ53_13710 [Kofleriaceae bacterium]|nr:hypothetical protein [Kofleriaceae bacterium]
MKKWILIFTLALTGVTFADEPRVPPEAPTAIAPIPGAEARQCCTQAMNADPDFAKSIISTVDKQIDQKTIDAHEAAAKKIQRDDAHVIYAYAAMFVVAALFLAFLWMRQQALMKEIAQLRRDLEAAAKGSK